MPEVNKIIYVRCSIKNTPIILEDLIQKQYFYNISKDIGNIKINNDTSLQAIIQSKEFNELKMDNFIKKYKYHADFDKLKIMKEIIQDLLFLTAKFSLDYLDSRGNKIEEFSINEKRGNKLYDSPKGWIGIGLNVLNKYDDGDNSWIGNNNSEKEWCVAYHGVGSYKTSDNVKNVISKIYHQGLKPGPNQAHSNCEDFYHKGKKVGIGVYCCDKIRDAEGYAGISQINGINYKTVIMVRIKPDALRKCYSCLMDFNLVVNGTTNEIRPYRLLYKKL